MSDILLALAYLGGYANLVLQLPRILATYRPRRDKVGKWRVEGVCAVVFSPPPDSSGAANRAMLRKFGNDLMGHHLVGHERDKTTGRLLYIFRVYVPRYRANWARDLFAYNGCIVEGMDAETLAARHAHGLPQSWADKGGWEGLRAREAAKQSKREGKPRGKALATTRLQRIARLFDE